MKVSELEGAELDHWVARAEGMKKTGTNYAGYSTHWAVGGPIIERERIETRPPNRTYFVWSASIDGHPLHWKPGETPLIAAMRAYVASRFGDEVDDC